MKQTHIKLWGPALLAAVLLLLGGCGQEPTPYETNDLDNYTLRVTYDAGDGTFTTNTSIITDTYSMEALTPNSQGKVEIPLLSPDDDRRGNDAFAPVKSGHFLAGWYAQRTETKDDKGNPVYAYSQPWDFGKDRLTLDAKGDYSATQSVLTLYAAWVPMFEVKFYDLKSGKLLETYPFDPATGTQLQLPAWDEKTGAMEMYKFPQQKGFTFAGAYYDAAGTQAVTTATLNHAGTVDRATGTATNPSMAVYLDWDEGEWYRISTVEQFLDNASVDGNYIINADLDFTDKIWPTSLLYGNFSGTIQGNGHTFRNITLTQTNNSKVNAGLFGQLTEKSALSDITFENVNFTIKAGTRMAGTGYGLLAGTISPEATFDKVSLKKGYLQIHSDSYFGSDDYAIGLVCGNGSADGVTTSDLTCVATGDAPEKVNITVSGNTVTLDFNE